MSPVFDVFLVDDSITRGRFAGGPVGDLRLLPDPARAVRLAALPGWAWAPVDRHSQDGRPHPQCARTFARRAVQHLAERGLEARMGFEVEWYVDAGHGDDVVPAAPGPAYGMNRLIELGGYCHDVLSALADQGVAVGQLHPEYTTSQFELSVLPEDPVGAADTTMLVRHTIHAVSQAHGLRASFAPAVMVGGVGNGGHVHVSLQRDGRNVTVDADGALGAEGGGFLAGVLAELPALLAVGAPSVASYLRLVPQRWAGAYRCWGHENREAAARLITDGVPPGPNANIEVKCFDQSANPYLLVGAVLAAGTAGIERAASLAAPVDVDPAWLSDDERRRLGIERLPASLDDAVTAFVASDVLRAALGEPLADTIEVVRRAEIELFAGRNPEQIVAATRWRY